MTLLTRTVILISQKKQTNKKHFKVKENGKAVLEARITLFKNDLKFWTKRKLQSSLTLRDKN